MGKHFHHHSTGLLVPATKPEYPINTRLAYKRAHDSNQTEQTIDRGARREGFFITEIVNTKRPVNFNLPKLSFKPERNLAWK